RDSLEPEGAEGLQPGRDDDVQEIGDEVLGWVNRGRLVRLRGVEEERRREDGCDRDGAGERREDRPYAGPPTRRDGGEQRQPDDERERERERDLDRESELEREERPEAHDEPS